MRLLIVGNRGGTNVGESFCRAAQSLGIEYTFCNVQEAFAAPALIARFNWRLRGHRPTHLDYFSRKVNLVCEELCPDILLSAGMVPITDDDLSRIGQRGTKRLIYLTDDPWNPSFHSSWFSKALPHYDVIFTPRQANLPELQLLRKPIIKYLPFGFEPELFFPETPSMTDDVNNLASDIMFAGGADRTRIPYISSLIRFGYQVGLYGDYWTRFRETRDYSRGHASPDILRRATCAAKVSLCLVRHSNRDGHVMRSFEIPAMGGCMLTEDTTEHRELFGAEGETVVYFSTIDEMLNKLRWLLDHPVERQRLATAAHQRITGGGNTYRDRLLAILQEVEIPVKQTSIPQ